MPDLTTPTEAGDAWRDHVLQEVVAFLDQNRDAIIERFETGDPRGLSREQLERSCLISTWPSRCTAIAATSGGSGFFKANLIR